MRFLTCGPFELIGQNERLRSEARDDFREKAPAGAYRNMYLDAKQNVIPGKSENGHLAAGVPGSVAGIFSYYKYAKLPFSKLIGPAINLAEKGFAITAAEASDLNDHQEDFKKFASIVEAMDKGKHLGKANFLKLINLALSMNGNGKYRKLNKQEVINRIESSETTR